jgi:hypothetical protein
MVGFLSEMAFFMVSGEIQQKVMFLEKIKGASSLNGRIVNWFNGRITEQLGLYRIYLDRKEKTWVSFMVIPPP